MSITFQIACYFLRCFSAIFFFFFFCLAMNRTVMNGRMKEIGFSSEHQTQHTRNMCTRLSAVVLEARIYVLSTLIRR